MKCVSLRTTCEEILRITLKLATTVGTFIAQQVVGLLNRMRATIPPSVHSTVSPMEGSPARNFAPHSLAAQAVLDLMDVTRSRGLSSEQVLARLAKYGLNAIEAVQPRSPWLILIEQFSSIVIALLAVAAGVALLTGDVLEAIAILVVLLINALVGFATEWQANRALDALRRQSHTLARVRRDQLEETIDAVALVPGDIIILNAGDRVPADARIIECYSVQAQESALTGESSPVEKSDQIVPESTPLAERTSMLHLGTSISTGRAVAVVVDTGAKTQLGRVGHLVAASTKERSPLERSLTNLGRRLVYVVLAVALVVMIAGWLRGDGLWIMVEVGISLAVAAVPEGLPAVTTLILALGVLRMAKQRAIVRRLTAVETLGSTTVICADKTGTMTENRMTVREYYLSDGRVIDVNNESAANGDELLKSALRVGVLCNEGVFQSTENQNTKTIGDPTETALLVVADALVLDVSAERANHPKLDEQPFQASTKRMTTIHRRSDGQHFAALKGAPGVVLEACSSYATSPDSNLPLDEAMRAKFAAANERMADRALRVLGLAVKHFDGVLSKPTGAELASGFVFLGFVGMIDPPRPGVANAIQAAGRAGIRTVMLTGDQLKTGRAIARELGLGSGEPFALSARELLDVDQHKLAELAQKADVFARVSPEDKLRIVSALQEAGQVVAVTGDGVNDAPALKRANIGIAMGQRGTEVAKEAADIVLADDNFGTILGAVEGGRTIYANIRKFVHMMFSHNLGEVIMIFSAISLGWPLPLLPLQILWMNLVTDVFPALALAVEPASPYLMHQPPRDPGERLLSRRFMVLIGWQALMIASVSLASYAWALRMYGPGSHSRTIALFALIGAQLGHMFNCRSRTRSAINGLFANPFIWLATIVVLFLQFLAVYFSPLARVLGTVRLGEIDWFVVGVCCVTPIFLVEITKTITRFRRSPIKDVRPQAG